MSTHRVELYDSSENLRMVDEYGSGHLAWGACVNWTWLTPGNWALHIDLDEANKQGDSYRPDYHGPSREERGEFESWVARHGMGR